LDNWIQTITEKIGMDDSKLSSSSSGENKNSMKNIGNFIIAGIGFLIAMGLVGILVYYKKKLPLINDMI
jgi:hypothetical protein